jgi:DNA-binding transcriptional ArsR family regulator
MRALAHEARLAILERLNSGQPATATECAEVVGLSPSATSYHLRALAKVGLVEQAPSRGDGRERLWRAPGGSLRFSGGSGPDADPDARDAVRKLTEVVLLRDDARVRRWLAREDQEPADWREAAVFAESVLTLDADELTALTEEVLDLVSRYRTANRADPPAASRQVSYLVRAFPVDLPTPGA